MKLSVFNVASQKTALEHIGNLVEKSSVHPLIRETALKLVSDCEDRDDMCEVEAIFEAVKYGNPNVPALKSGLKYVADPRWADHFTAPPRLLEQLARGINGGDCDDHTMLIGALLAALGFRVGARAWGRQKNNYSHVYAVVGFPKRNPTQEIGLDSTVKESFVGWEPPAGHVLTAWIE